MNISGIQEWLTPQIDQRITAVHEAGHCVIANLLSGYPGASGIKIWPSNPASAENWWGVCEIFEGRQGWTGEWDAAMAWRHVLVGYGGPAASLKLERGDMTPEKTRGNWTAIGGDENHASETVNGMWPDEYAEIVLNLAASVACELVSNVGIWRAILAVADFALTRRGANATEIELLIHRHVPDPIEPPRMAFALGLLA